MQRGLALLLIALALLAALALRRDAPSEQAVTDDVSAPVRPASQGADLVRPPEVELDRATADGRRSLDATPSTESETANAPTVHPVAGIVVDARGRPVADALVHYNVYAVPDEGFVAPSVAERRIVSFSSSNTVSIELPDVRLPVRTDSTGAFHFLGSDRRAGGHLRFAEGSFLEGWVEAHVDPDTDLQVLRVPEPPAQDSEWEFFLVPSTGMAPVPLAGVDVEFLGGDWPEPRRMPSATEREVEATERGTRILQRGLAPGTYRFSFDLTHGLLQRVVVVIDDRDTEGRTTVIVTHWPGATTLDVEAATGDELPWIDGSTGLATWLPTSRRRLGEHGHNLFFAETLRIGHGPVRAAELTLGLRSNSGAGSNDTISLEHTGARTFAWSARITEFTRTWQTSRFALLHLDLARLPGLGSSEVDLRSRLEDGLLDVVIQDDTTVEHLSIRVVR